MNKLIVPQVNYEFDASQKTITISGAAFTSLFNEESILLVTNVTDNIIIYNPYCDGFGGTFNTTDFILTLEYDTTGMEDTDNIQIIMYDSSPLSVTPSGDVEVVQPTHDDFNANVNLQVSDVDASFTNPVPVYFGDSPNLDAFGRLRVSELTTQFDGKQIHDALPLFYDSETIGAASIAHSTANAESTLSLTGLDAGEEAVIFQTKQRFNYRSGKSALMLMTFRNFNNEAGVTKRAGYYNSNTSSSYDSNKDGFWIENTGSGVQFIISKNGTANTITQANWNGDKLDGTGASGLNLNLGTEDGNLLWWANYEWLGVGAVTMGFVYNNAFYVCHREDHIGEDGVYMESPNHSLRYEIRCPGTNSGTFRAICSTFSTEGTINKLGKVLSENLGTAHVNANSTSNKYALLGMRLASSSPDALIDIIDYSVLATTSDNQLIEVWLNPNVSGTFTYNAVSNSVVEVAKGASGGTNQVTGGTLLYSDYINNQQAFQIGVENAVRLGMKIDGTADTIVISANPLSSNSDVLASVKWRELA